MTNLLNKIKSKINISSNMKDIVQLLMVLLIMVVFASILSKGVFIQPLNLYNILTQNSILLVVSLGQLLIIITKGIDLSVGMIVGFTSVLIVLSQDYGSVLAIIFALCAVVIIGIASGSLVHFAKLPAFVVTLAMSQIVYSIAKVIGGGAAVYSGFQGSPIASGLLSLYTNSFLGIQYPLIITIICIIVISRYLKTSIGHFTYTIGGNQKTAYLSGVPIARVKITAYVLAGLLACIGGLLFVARVGLGDPQAGDALTMDSIAAVTVGGASLSGGAGTVTGTVIGVLILGVLNNILNLLNVPPAIQPAIKGGLILLAVYLNSRKTSER
jgi:ribose transport system permease protein